MVRVRVIKPEQVGPTLSGPPLGLAVILRAHAKPPPGSFFGHVRQRVRAGDHPVAADDRPAALVGVRLRAMTPDGAGDSRPQREDHRRLSPCADSSQKRSERYFSPPSQKTTTMTASDVRRATRNAPARLAPLEMPTKSPPMAS